MKGGRKEARKGARKKRGREERRKHGWKDKGKEWRGTGKDGHCCVGHHPIANSHHDLGQQPSFGDSVSPVVQ